MRSRQHWPGQNWARGQNCNRK